jgi:predicted MFS family arabinose efflux permease
VLFLWGVCAAIGVVCGGLLSDRIGPLKVIVPAISLMAIAFAALSFSQIALSPAVAVFPVLAAIAIWGVAHWAFYPAQQARLIDTGGVSVAPIVLSLNASFMYIGFSLGAALGGATLARVGVGSLGWIAALCEVLAVGATCALALGRSRIVAVKAASTR